MIQIPYYLKDPKLWELWYIPHYGEYRNNKEYTMNPIVSGP